MRKTDRPDRPLLEADAGAPPPVPAPPEPTPPSAYAIPAAIGLVAGGAVLTAAIVWGAAEAAVGVLAAYLVYNLVSGRASPDVAVSGISRLTTILRGPGTPPGGAQQGR